MSVQRERNGMNVRQVIEEFRHCTWGGRREMVWFAIRRWFVAPAPRDYRCCMGATVGPYVHCPRWASSVALWCSVHAREIERAKRARVRMRLSW